MDMTFCQDQKGGIRLGNEESLVGTRPWACALSLNFSSFIVGVGGVGALLALVNVESIILEG